MLVRLVCTARRAPAFGRAPTHADRARAARTGGTVALSALRYLVYRRAHRAPCRACSTGSRAKVGRVRPSRSYRAPSARVGRTERGVDRRHRTQATGLRRTGISRRRTTRRPATSTTGGELARRARRAPDAEDTAGAAGDDSCDGPSPLPRPRGGHDHTRRLDKILAAFPVVISLFLFLSLPLSLSLSLSLSLPFSNFF